MPENKQSFVAYYNKYKDKIFAYFLYRVGFDRRLAEDLTSEAFLKAFRNFDGFDQSRPFQSWIYKIAHNHLVNHYKTAKREVPLESVAEPLKFVHIEIEEKFELERALKIIDLMEETDKEVLLLRFVQELTNNEIAQIMDKEEGAIRTQMSRSLVKLREILNQPR